MPFAPSSVLVTTSKAPVPSSDALVPTSFFAPSSMASPVRSVQSRTKCAERASGQNVQALLTHCAEQRSYKLLVGTSASLLVTSALLVVTRSYYLLYFNFNLILIASCF